MSDEEITPEELRAIGRRNLLKLAVRVPVWLGLAWLITHYFPDAKWVWYVVPLLVAVSVAFSAYAMHLARSHETHDSSEK